MPRNISLKELLQIKHPIIQAPMAGGATTPELMAAVGHCGGLGSLGAGYMQPEAITEAIQQLKQLTNKPYQANVFVTHPISVNQASIIKTCKSIQSCAKELECIIAPPSPPYLPNMEKQIETLLNVKTPIISFTFGIPDKHILQECQKQKCIIMGTATNLEEAQAWEEQYIDVIVLQGSEAGGHRGTFLTEDLQSLYPVEDLFLQCKQIINLPLVVSGGICSAKRIQHFMQQGAAACQIGTAFLCTKESGIPEIYKQTLAKQTEDHTVLTRAFSGKYARGIRNAFIDCMEKKSEDILPYPTQNKITKQMRDRAKALENPEYMSLWAGQSVAEISYHSCESLFELLTQG